VAGREPAVEVDSWRQDSRQDGHNIGVLVPRFKEGVIGERGTKGLE